jgi:hypothetical protein
MIQNMCFAGNSLTYIPFISPFVHWGLIITFLSFYMFNGMEQC